MKNKIIALAIAILLPNLALACGFNSVAGRVMLGVLNWVTALAGFGSIATLIILSIIRALKKDAENKRPKWWTIFIAIAIVSSCICAYLGEIWACIVSFSAFLILMVVVAFKKDEENKRSKWWMIFATAMLVFSILGFVAIRANENMCGGNSNF